MNTKLLLKPRRGIADVLENYRMMRNEEKATPTKEVMAALPTLRERSASLSRCTLASRLGAHNILPPGPDTRRLALPNRPGILPVFVRRGASGN